jgi:Asp-tRNA(Asn)/Glu-tRNA(Gln) amidotransferase A subunit family amidase
MAEKTVALNQLGAFEAARKLTRREITAEQLVRDCLDRIEQREPVVQAWTHVAGVQALTRARELDRGPVVGLLHGLPVGVKDLFDTVDMPSSYGSPIYARHRPVADAATVALCREAGAIVLGKTVTTEFATFHPGKTRNPCNPEHTPGGSSSGSAAAVADCMVPLAFGTQTAASIIRPAAFCGIVGYKPSFGRIARAGIKSLAESLDTVGAFGRSVEDVALFVAALTADKRLLELEGAASPKIGICKTYEWPHADSDTQAALERAILLLSQSGAQVGETTLPALFSTLVQVQTDIMAYEAARSLAYERLNHAQALSGVLADVLQAGMEISAEKHEDNLRTAQRARVMINECFDGNDVLLAPSAIGAAPSGLQATGNPIFCRMWTLLGLPCVHLPFAHAENGLPVGLQMIGRFGNDRKLLQVAHWAHARLRHSAKAASII